MKLIVREKDTIVSTISDAQVQGLANILLEPVPSTFDGSIIYTLHLD